MNNRRIEYLGGLESTAAKERIQPEEPQRAINLVSIPQNFLKREISLTFLFLPSGTILVNVNYILPPIITKEFSDQDVSFKEKHSVLQKLTLHPTIAHTDYEGLKKLLKKH